jgi:hypothetical protein
VSIDEDGLRPRPYDLAYRIIPACQYFQRFNRCLQGAALHLDLEEGAFKQRLRELGERLDAHRKRRQALQPDLTLTGLCNVLEKLRQQSGPHSPLCGAPRSSSAPHSPEGGPCADALGGNSITSLPHAAQGIRFAASQVRTTLGTPLTPKEHLTHDQGLVSVLGRKAKKRSDPITAILATLRALGHLA